MATAVPDTSQYVDSADILNTLRENIDTCKQEITDNINYYKSLFDQQKTELFAELDEIYHKHDVRLATANEDIKSLCKLKEDSCKNITKNTMKDDLDGILGYIDEKINMIKKRFEEDIPYIGIYSHSGLKDKLEGNRIEIRESIGPYKYKRDPIWRCDTERTPEGHLRKPDCLSIDKMTKLIYVGDGSKLKIYDMAGNYKSCINTCLNTIENIQAANQCLYTVSKCEMTQSNTGGNKTSNFTRSRYTCTYSLAKLNKNNGDVVHMITLGEFLNRSNTLLSIDSNETNIYTATQQHHDLHDLIPPNRHNNLITLHNNLITVYKCSDLEQINKFTLTSDCIKRKDVKSRVCVISTLENIKMSDNKLYALFRNCDFKLLVFSLEGVLIKNLVPREKEREWSRLFCIDSSNNIILGYGADIIIYNTDGKAMHSLGKHRNDKKPSIAEVDVCDQTIIVLYDSFFRRDPGYEVKLAAF